MNNSKSGLKRETVQENIQNIEESKMYIQPFKEIPSLNNAAQDNADRMNAHDLFSHYTADIIKEDIVYAR